jgi:adenosylmethionine-8-amino-7-oxononanoate aminotransferase
VLSPPLVITREEVDRIVERAQHAIDLTQRDLDL